MSDSPLKIPAPAEEWGRLAVSIPGWRWMPGVRDGRTGERYEDGDGPWIVNKWPDPDDPATEGCLLALLGAVAEAVWFSGDCSMWAVQHDGERLLYTSLGRACIAAAAALGRWPEGAE